MDSRRHAVVRAAGAGLRRALGCGFWAAGLFGLAVQPTFAQGFDREVYEPRGVYAEDDDPIRPREVVETLRDRGFTEIGRPRYDGRTYRVEATGPRGLRVRLLVDARDGAVIGREPVSEAYYPSASPRPVAPGYGWTEEDVQPRRLREAERIVPPANIPSVPVLRGEPLGEARDGGRGRRVERPAPTIRPGANPQGLNPQGLNPQGLNPDAVGRSEAPRRVARTAPPSAPRLPSQVRIAPNAPEPAPRATAPAGMTPAAKSETREAKAVQPSVVPAKMTPEKIAPERIAPAKDAVEDGARGETRPPAKTATSTAEKTVTSAAEKKGWQDPLPESGRKNVRVIGGATVVPGGTGEAGAN